MSNENLSFIILLIILTPLMMALATVVEPTLSTGASFSLGLAFSCIVSKFLVVLYDVIVADAVEDDADGGDDDDEVADGDVSTKNVLKL